MPSLTILKDVVGNALRTMLALIVAAAVVPAGYATAEITNANETAKRGIGGQPEVFAAIRASGVAGVRSILRAHPGAIAQRDSTGMTPLVYAGAVGEMDLVKLLLERGAPANQADPHGRTPAWWAAFWERPEMI